MILFFKTILLLRRIVAGSFQERERLNFLYEPTVARRADVVLSVGSLVFVCVEYKMAADSSLLADQRTLARHNHHSANTYTHTCMYTNTDCGPRT